MAEGCAVYHLFSFCFSKQSVSCLEKSFGKADVGLGRSWGSGAGRGGTSCPRAACEKCKQSGLQVEPSCLCTQSGRLSGGWALLRSAHAFAFASAHNAFGISAGTLGPRCLPDTDCGLGMVHPREKIGACLGIVNTIPFLSTHLSLKETSCSK